MLCYICLICSGTFQHILSYPKPVSKILYLLAFLLPLSLSSFLPSLQGQPSLDKRTSQPNCTTHEKNNIACLGRVESPIAV